MKINLRVVIDTNVLVSSLAKIKNSPSYQILKSIRAGEIIFSTSNQILEEVRNVIGRERIVKFTKMTIAQRENFMDLIIRRSDLSEGKTSLTLSSRDIKDNMFLVCAYEVQADYLITGDRDLLVLKEFAGTKIVTPREFVNILKKINSLNL